MGSILLSHTYQHHRSRLFPFLRALGITPEEGVQVCASLSTFLLQLKRKSHKDRGILVETSVPSSLDKTIPMDSYTRDFPDNTYRFVSRWATARHERRCCTPTPCRCSTCSDGSTRTCPKETAGHEREGAGDHGERTLTRMSCVCGVWCMGSEP